MILYLYWRRPHEPWSKLLKYSLVAFDTTLYNLCMVPFKVGLTMAHIKSMISSIAQTVNFRPARGTVLRPEDHRSIRILIVGYGLCNRMLD